jgi:Transcriptional regulator containing an amidase domain and an AraC-type DNA-binding HTH domain
MPFSKYDHTDKQIKYIKNSLAFMEKNLNTTLTLQDLVSFNNLSKSQLTEIFKTKTGYSPIDYFIRLKIQKACSLLDLSDLSIYEIAAQLGYEDQYYFSRSFRKIMGMSPSSYRKIKKG